MNTVMEKFFLKHLTTLFTSVILNGNKDVRMISGSVRLVRTFFLFCWRYAYVGRSIQKSVGMRYKRHIR